MIQNILSASQSYIQKRAEELNYRINLIEHETQSATCEERAALLGISPERVVRSLYFSCQEKYIGVILPGSFGKIQPRDLFPTLFGMSKSQANRYSLQKTPQGMKFGTCTPFPQEEIVATKMDHLLIYNHRTKETPIYAAAGGESESAERISLVLPSYKAIYEILAAEFGCEKVKIIF